MLTAMLATLACSGKSNGEVDAPVKPSVEEPSGPTSPPPPQDAEAPGAVVATWLGEPCGERAYPRELTFTPDFRYHGRDLISPCPEGVTCIWSGILEYTGTWQGDANLITLHEESAQSSEQGQPRPTAMRHTHSGHLTTEPREGVICGFTKQDASGTP